MAGKAHAEWKKWMGVVVFEQVWGYVSLLEKTKS